MMAAGLDRTHDAPQMSWFEKKRMSNADFQRLGNYVTTSVGIKLPESKRTMLEGRLQKRLKVVHADSFEQYLDYVFSEHGQMELIHMIDSISTNKTDFFREAAHFDYLTTHVLPEFQADEKQDKLNIWSAAASTGEEIYTLAMVLNEYNRLMGRAMDFHILGTDISMRALEHAVRAVYKHERIANMPMDLRKRYFLRSKDRRMDHVRVAPMLRSKAHFKRLNLMDDIYNLNHQMFDVIFCRNVLIYFDKKTQEQVVNKLSNHLNKGGYLFLGHSESIIGKKVSLTQIKPTIYKKTH